MKESVSTRETVDTMTLDILNGSGGLRAVKVLPNGKRRFDPVEKDRLIDAAMKPGVSVERKRSFLRMLTFWNDRSL